MIWVLALLWIGFAGSEGLAHASVFAHGNTNRIEGFKVHKCLVPIRAFGFVLVMLHMLQQPVWDAVALALFCLCSHPLWHNGIYYEARRRFDTPRYHFFSHGTGSSASTRFGPVVRVVLFGSGVGVLLANIFIF